MSLFRSGASAGLFGRAGEATLQNPPEPAARPSYTAREPKDEAERISKQIGDTAAAVRAGFKAAGGATPAGPGAPRDGAGVR